MSIRFTAGIHAPISKADEVKTPPPMVVKSSNAPVNPQIKRRANGDKVSGSRINPYRWNVGKSQPFPMTRYWKQNTWSNQSRKQGQIRCNGTDHGVGFIQS